MSYYGSEFDLMLRVQARIWTRRVELAIVWGLIFGMAGGLPLGFLAAWWLT